MTIFDYLVLLILTLSVVIGLFRGLVKEILSLLSWIISLVVANAYGKTVAVWLPEAIPGDALRLIVAFIGLLIGVKILVGLLSLALELAIKASGMTMADRGLGALFGVARAMVIVLAAVILCGLTAIPKQPFWRDAISSGWCVTAAKVVLPLLPGDFARHVQF